MRILLLLVFSNIVFGTGFSQASSGSDTLSAHNYLVKALDFKSSSNYNLDSSDSYLKLAAEEFKKSGFWDRYFYCHYNVGYNLSSRRNHKGALDYMLSIKDEFGNHLDPASASTFGFYWQIGWAYSQINNYIMALSYYDKVSEAMKLCKQPVASYRKIRIVYDKSVIYLRLRRLEQALKLNEEVLVLGEEYDNHEYDANAFNNLGIIYRKLGDYKRSLNFYERALTLASKIYEERGFNMAGLCPFYNNLSMLYLDLGDIDKSAEYAREGLKLYYEHTDRWYSIYSSLKYDEIEIYLKREEFDKALEESRKTLAYTIQQGGSGIQLVGLIRYLGKSFYYKNEFDSAEYYFQQFLQIAGDQRSLIEGTAQVRMDLAEVYSKQDRLNEALKEAQLGIVTIAEGFESEDISDNPTNDHVIINSQYLLNLLSLKTQYLVRLYERSDDVDDNDYLRLANLSNTSARSIVAHLREQLYYKSSKLALAEFANQIFEQGIVINNELYLQTGQKEYSDELLSCFEGNRANLIAEAFQVSKVQGFTNLPDSIIDAEVSLYNLIAEKESLLLNSTDSAKSAELKSELFGLNRNFEEILDQKRGFQPGEIFTGDGIEIGTIQSMLESDEIILEYFSGEDNGHLLAITGSSIKYFNLGRIQEMDSLVSRFVDLIKDPNSDSYTHYGREIYNKVLFPAIGVTDISKLVIIPDGSLSYLPFEALIVGDKSNPGVDDFLIQSYTIRNHYSVALFKQLNESETGESLKSYIGFAPDFSLESKALIASRSAGDLGLSTKLEKLPGAEMEIETAAGYFKGLAVIGSGATETYFKEVASGYDLIHLASHTLVDIDDPMYSKLIFAGEESDNDGLLHLYELYGMKLKCSLVSLSACNTGVGKAYKGEGMMSLGRGFMGAGAKNVLMTLWSVSDQSSSRIMNSFFKGLKNGDEGPEAIRQAKLNYLNTSDELTSHPYYWSGYVFIGNGSNPGSNYLQWVAGIILVFGAVLLYRKIKFSS